jgi:hypothetical protein
MKGVKAGLFACLVLLVDCVPAVAAPAASSTPPTGWAVHEAAGLRIETPAEWRGPEVLPANGSSGPRAWVVFRDPSGVEAVTLVTWRGATASSLAREQFQSEIPQGSAPTELALVDGARTRTAIALTGFAQWSDANGSGQYECRHLYVQLDPGLVAAVIACGARIRGTSTPTSDLRRMQERVALRLSATGGRP